MLLWFLKLAYTIKAGFKNLPGNIVNWIKANKKMKTGLKIQKVENHYESALASCLKKINFIGSMGFLIRTNCSFASLNINLVGLLKHQCHYN